MFERFDPPLIPNPGPDDLAGAKARWAARRRRVLLAASGTSAVVVIALAALLAPSFASGDRQQHVTSTGRATTTTQPAPSTTEAPTSSTTARRLLATTIAPPPTTSHPATRVETYSPWTSSEKLAPGIVVSQRISGTSCDTPSSFDTGSAYAWRCSMADGGFYDPCFAPMYVNATQVVCPRDPWSPVTLMTLSQPLANTSWGTAKPDLDVPWAMLLANGQRCAVIHGTGTQIGRTMFNYGCGPGYGTEPDRKTEPWTVSYSPSQSGPITTVTVKTAWI